MFKTLIFGCWCLLLVFAQMGASFEEVVEGAESLKPVLLLKAVVNSVTFRLTIITIRF